MKLIPLTKGQFAIVDDEDFEYLNQWKWYANKIKGIWYVIRGAQIIIDRKTFEKKKVCIYMHREIMKPTHRNEVIDHKDGNGLNNQRANLRLCTHQQNLSNRFKRTDTNGIINIKEGSFDRMDRIRKQYSWGNS